MKLSPTTLLPEGLFWQLIERSLGDSEGVALRASEQQKRLERVLEDLSEQKHAGFLGHFSAFYRRALRNDLKAVAYVVMGGCGDDGFMDFRTWLVTRGESVYAAAMRNPDTLAGEFDRIPKGDVQSTDGARTMRPAFGPSARSCSSAGSSAQAGSAGSSRVSHVACSGGGAWVYMGAP
jgi:hypothetical protein